MMLSKLKEWWLLVLVLSLATDHYLQTFLIPGLHLELLEMWREAVELVMLLPWNLLPPPWKCLCHTLLRCCCWNEGPDRKGFSLSSSFRKTSLQLFFDLTDSVKWSLNSFSERFHHWFAATLLYSLPCFLPSEESTRSIESRTLDDTKSNYLFDQVNKWFVLEDLKSDLEIKEERRLLGILQL